MQTGLNVDSVPVHLAHDSACTTFPAGNTSFLLLDLWPPYSPDLNLVHYEIRGATVHTMHQQLHRCTHEGLH